MKTKKITFNINTWRETLVVFLVAVIGFSLHFNNIREKRETEIQNYVEQIETLYEKRDRTSIEVVKHYYQDSIDYVINDFLKNEKQNNN